MSPFSKRLTLKTAALALFWTSIHLISSSVFHDNILSEAGIRRSNFLFLVSCLSLTAFMFWRFLAKAAKSRQKLKVLSEKYDEETNLLRNKIHENTRDFEHLANRIERLSSLRDIIKSLSSSLSEDNVVKNTVESASFVIGKSDRVLFFLVDTLKQDLDLVFSKRTDGAPPILLKRGDIFDRWVFKKRQPLLVEDARRDFRFSLEGENLEEDFESLISAPLASKDKVLGILRMDSKKKSLYTQEDLRLLDIISDLASVALENAVLYKRVGELAIRDGLTSLYVHRYFKERLANETKRALKSGKGFSLVLMDIDDFKGYNDKYGHTAGDLALKHISRIISESLGGGDIAARYGGEEFALLFPGKDKKEGLALAEDLRKKIEKTPIILRREKIAITVSAGIAACPEDSTLTEDLIRGADKRLYKAKKEGKNRICAH